MGKDLYLSIGNGGWLEVTGLPKNRRWFVRANDSDGRLTIDELYAPAGVNAGALASFPARMIEEWINRPDVAARIRRHIDFPAPDLRRAISYYASGPGRQDVNGRGDHWCTEMLLAQLPFETRGCNKADEPDHAGGARAPQTWPDGHVVKGVPRPPMMVERGSRVRPTPADAFVDVPKTHPYGDAFYARVARAHADLCREAREAGRRPRPAADIAEANDVPVSTANRWILVARELGLLAPRG